MFRYILAASSWCDEVDRIYNGNARHRPKYLNLRQESVRQRPGIRSARAVLRPNNANTHVYINNAMRCDTYHI